MWYILAQIRHYTSDVVPSVSWSNLLADATRSPVFSDDTLKRGEEVVVYAPSTVTAKYWTHLFIFAQDPDITIATYGKAYANVYDVESVRMNASQSYVTASYNAAWTYALNQNQNYHCTLVTDRLSVTDDIPAVPVQIPRRSTTVEPLLEGCSIRKTNIFDMADPGSHSGSQAGWTLVVTCAVHPLDGTPIGSTYRQHGEDQPPSELEYNGIISPPYALACEPPVGWHTEEELIADLIADFNLMVEEAGEGARRMLRAQLVPTSWIKTVGDHWTLKLGRIDGDLIWGRQVKYVAACDTMREVFADRIDPITSLNLDIEKAHYYNRSYDIIVNGVKQATIPAVAVPRTGLQLAIGYTLSSGVSVYARANDVAATRVPIPVPEFVAWGDAYGDYVQRNEGIMQAQSATTAVGAVVGLSGVIGGLVTGNIPAVIGGVASLAATTTQIVSRDKQLDDAMHTSGVSSNGAALTNSDETTPWLRVALYAADTDEQKVILRRYGYSHRGIYRNIPVLLRDNYTYVSGVLTGFGWEYDASSLSVTDMTVTPKQHSEALSAALASGVLFWHPATATSYEPGDVENVPNPQ